MAHDTEVMHFGFQKTERNKRLYMEVATDVLENLRQLPGTAQRLKKASSNRLRLVDVETGDDVCRLFVNFKKVGSIKEDTSKRAAGLLIETIVNDVQSVATDPLVKVDLGTEATDRGRYSLQAELRWPDSLTDQDIQYISTEIMRDTAKKLKSPAVLSEFVYAQVNRSHWVSFFVNDMGGCELCTYGGYYKPEEPVFALSAGNLYHPDMQLVCFSGAVAFAHAAELATE